MLVLKIIATVFLGLSCITSVIKNASIFANVDNEIPNFCIWSLYSLLWRAFVITALWVH